MDKMTIVNIVKNNQSKPSTVAKVPVGTYFSYVSTALEELLAIKLGQPSDKYPGWVRVWNISKGCEHNLDLDRIVIPIDAITIKIGV